MKHMKFLTFFFCIAFAVFACSSNNETDPNAGGLPDKEEPLTTDFAKGADIGWCTEYESKGYDFYNAKGEKRECTALMKELGLNAIRIRVWVDPTSEVVYPMNWANLGAFITTGYDAVKSVCPDAIVIVHLDNGWDNGLFNWFFDELKKNGGKWDMIGMSLYPYWSRDAKPEYTAADAVITDCIKNIKAVSAKYNCDVMVVETGMECADDKGNLASASVLAEGKRQLARILKECKENTGGRCKGVFYWEPECRPNQYRLGAFTEDGRPTVIMDAFK